MGEEHPKCNPRKLIFVYSLKWAMAQLLISPQSETR